MKPLTQEEKAKVINLIGLQFVKNDDKVEVELTDDSTILTPYTYYDLAMMIIAKLNTVSTQEKYRLRKALQKSSPNRLKIIDILQIGKLFYH